MIALIRRESMTEGVVHFNIGQFECSAISDGNDSDRNILLVNTGRNVVLIDTGNGDTTVPRGLLLDRLQVAGFAPREIDFVILSHADFDHIGGAVNSEGNV